MNILYCTDDNYIFQMVVSIKSLLKSNPETDVTIYIMTLNLNRENRLILMRELAECPCNYRMLIVNQEDLEDMTGEYPKNFPFGYYLFLFSHKYIDADKVIIIDCDMIIRGKMEELWEMETKTYMAGAVLDAIDPYYKLEAGIRKTDKYYNSGLILANLRAWREECIEQKAYFFLKSRKFNLHFRDQAIINAIFQHRIFTIQLKYNVMPFVYEFEHKELAQLKKLRAYYNERDYIEAREKPIIIHFCQGFEGRPWISGCKHPQSRCFTEIAREIPGFELGKEEKRSISLRLMSTVYEKGPRILFRILSDIRQVLLPMSEHIKKKA